MKYIDKVIFGIFEDNPSFKIVQMRWYNGTAMLINLQKTMLDKSFYADRPNQEFVVQDEETDLHLSSVLPFDHTTTQAEQESDTSDSQIIPPESRLLDFFALDEGRIALNANDERLSVYQLNVSAQSKNIIRVINKEILNPDDRKNKQTVFGIIPQIGDNCTVIVHKGVNNLLDYLWRYNREHTAKRFFYTIMDPNDISLINILNANYDFPADTNALLLYLGFEYKRGILIRDGAFVKSFPIQTASHLFTNRDEIYSKLLLGLDEAQISDPQYLILAGENSKNEDVSYFQKKFPKTEVSRMTFKNMLVSEDESDPISEEDLAEYAIPIALAWKSMDSMNKKFINTNFLQKKIIESQKIFKLAWHGFIILFLLFFYTAYSTRNFLNLSNELSHQKKANVVLESELRSYKTKLESNIAGLMSVESLQGQQQKILELLKGKNEWGYILNVLANSVGNHPISWIINLKSDKESFTITGITSKRTNILAFAQLFPDGKISKVTNQVIGKTQMWNFELSFSYPKLETIMQGQKMPTPPVKEKAIENKAIPSAVQKANSTAKNLNQAVSNNKVQQQNQKTTTSKNETKKSKPKNSTLQEYQNLRTLYDNNKNEVVLEKAKLFIQNHPNSPYAYYCKYMLAESLYMLNKSGEAILIFDQIISENKKKTPDAYYMKGACYLALKDTVQAKENFKIVIEQYPKSDVVEKAVHSLEVLP